MIISGLISFFVLKPVYKAKSTLIVNTEKYEGTQMITGDQISISQKLAVTYGEIIKSRTVLEKVNNDNFNFNDENYDEYNDR